MSFEIQADTTIFMLDVYVYTAGELAGYQRLPGEQATYTRCYFHPCRAGLTALMYTAMITIWPLYYMTSNTSLNFNKYRESFSTVENGYGVFGALNHARFYLKKYRDKRRVKYMRAVGCDGRLNKKTLLPDELTTGFLIFQ